MIYNFELNQVWIKSSSIIRLRELKLLVSTLHHALKMEQLCLENFIVTQTWLFNQ